MIGGLMYALRAGKARHFTPHMIVLRFMPTGYRYLEHLLQCHGRPQGGKTPPPLEF